jgi:hypothetical protein
MLINSLNEIKDNESLMYGLDLVFKKLSKVYPFVTGWKLEDDYDSYKTTLFINIIIDYDKLIELYPDLEINNHIKNVIRNQGKYEIYTFKNIFSSQPKNLDFGDKTKIDNLLNNSYFNLYKSLSDYVIEVEWFENFVDKVLLKVNSFILKSDNISQDEEELPF